MNKQIIWGIIILIIIVLGGWVVNVMFFSETNVQNCCSENADVKGQALKTSEWKVYTRDNMYEFSYPTYGKIEETNSVVTDTTVVLTNDWMNTFDVTTHPEEIFCKSNPYINIKNAVKEDTITKYGKEYRHLHYEDSSSPTKTIIEDRYYKFNGNTCYMIVLRKSEKAGSQIVADIEKIFSTFKFAN